MKKLLIATSNKGKLEEIKEKLKDIDFGLVGLNEMDEKVEIAENAKTLEGNAITKAIILGNRFNMLTLADDTGLEVDALDGAPGVKTARYAPGTDEDRYTKLIKEMEGVEEKDRTARFHTMIAIYDPATEEVQTCEGLVEGKIAAEPVGQKGFGYDPVFFITEVNKMAAELTVEEKNAVDHRGRALEKAIPILEGLK